MRATEAIGDCTETTARLLATVSEVAKVPETPGRRGAARGPKPSAESVEADF